MTVALSFAGFYMANKRRTPILVTVAHALRCVRTRSPLLLPLPQGAVRLYVPTPLPASSRVFPEPRAPTKCQSTLRRQPGSPTHQPIHPLKPYLQSAPLIPGLAVTHVLSMTPPCLSAVWARDGPFKSQKPATKVTERPARRSLITSRRSSLISPPTLDEQDADDEVSGELAAPASSLSSLLAYHFHPRHLPCLSPTLRRRTGCILLTLGGWSAQDHAVANPGGLDAARAITRIGSCTTPALKTQQPELHVSATTCASLLLGMGRDDSSASLKRLGGPQRSSGGWLGRMKLSRVDNQYRLVELGRSHLSRVHTKTADRSWIYGGSFKRSAMVSYVGWVPCSGPELARRPRMMDQCGALARALGRPGHGTEKATARRYIAHARDGGGRQSSSSRSLNATVASPGTGPAPLEVAEGAEGGGGTRSLMAGLEGRPDVAFYHVVMSLSLAIALVSALSGVHAVGWRLVAYCLPCHPLGPSPRRLRHFVSPLLTPVLVLLPTAGRQ